MFRGGIPDTEWGKMIGRHGLVHNPAWPPPEKEEIPAAVVREEDDFLADINTPALICATWSNHGVHTRGSFRAYCKISSQQKWLYTHGRQEWSEFYTAEAQTMRKLFFDHFLKGTDSRILDIPRVRLELYLDAIDNSLKLNKNNKQGKTSYDSANGKAVFDYKFKQDTELTGYMSLNLWVSPEKAEDMDLFITLKKFDHNGKEVFFDAWLMLGRYPVALGWLRLSHRGLNKKKSTPWEPYPEHVTGPGEKVKPGEIVPCKVPILPSATLFRKGETLKLIVSGIFGGGEINDIPYGFNASVNRGIHSIYTGGKYCYYLLVPVLRL
jgi:predicted acyl esterase